MLLLLLGKKWNILQFFYSSQIIIVIYGEIVFLKVKYKYNSVWVKLLPRDKKTSDLEDEC